MGQIQIRDDNVKRFAGKEGERLLGARTDSAGKPVPHQILGEERADHRFVVDDQKTPLGGAFFHEFLLRNLRARNNSSPMLQSRDCDVNRSYAAQLVFWR